MTADPNAAAIVLLSWAATYLIHSTTLVASVWLFLKLRRSTGHALREILWKTALVGGVLIATAQMLVVPGGRFADWEIAVAQFRTQTKSVPRSDSEDRGIRRGSGETASVANADDQ